MRNPLAWFRGKPAQEAATVQPRHALAHIVERYARKMPAATPEYLDTERQVLQAKREGILESYQRAMADLLATESAGKQDLERQRDAALKPIDDQLGEARARIEHHGLDTDYPRISMDFLRLRKDPNGMQVPAVAIFSTSNPVCQIEIRMAKDGEKRRRIGALVEPEEFLPFFSDMLDRLEKRYHSCGCSDPSHITACLNVGFGGLVPADARAAIVKARREFDELYFVADAPVWSTAPLDNGRPKAMTGRDALLIGRKAGRHWLITSFQTVTAKEYINGKPAPGGAKKEGS